MAKRRMSPEARRRISEAAKRRWAAYRAGKGKRMGRKKAGRGWSAAKRAAQSRKIKAALARRRMGGGRSAPAGSSLSGISTDALIATRRRIDQELADRLIRGETS
jgi:uncharacterized protein YgiB involved in biofilm formation